METYSMDHFVENFAEILGIDDGETIQLLTPQFEREYKLKIAWIPQTADEFDEVKKLPAEILLKMGVRKWQHEGNQAHYLYAGEWFDNIPDGYAIVSITGKEKKFKKGVSDDDIRFGCLAYGFIREEELIED